MRYKDACEIAKEVLREITESDNAVCYINWLKKRWRNEMELLGINTWE